MENYSEIKNEIKLIAELFKLGEVVSVETKESNVQGFNVALFNTEKENNLKFFYKI